MSGAPPIPFDYQSRTRIVFGIKAVERAGELARETGIKNALVVTDPGIVAAGHLDGLRRALGRAKVKIVLFDKVRENPTTEDVDECLRAARGAKIDGIIGLGGGSSMDTAKGCNFLLTNGGIMRDYWGVGRATRPMLPLIAIPTTAGTGSECQSFALIADVKTRQKMACGDPKAAPRIAILDPLLTLSQPPRVAACSGIAALAHALAQRRSRRDALGQQHRDPRCSRHLGASTRKGLRPEAGVVANAQALLRVFLGVDVGGNGLGGDANVGKGEVVGDDGPPAVCAELDRRLWHDEFRAPCLLG